MSAGDKDRSGFHRVGGSLTQNQSRDPTQEHEHCMPNMLADPAGIKCQPADRVAFRRGSGPWEERVLLLRAAKPAVVIASAATQSRRMDGFQHPNDNPMNAPAEIAIALW